MEHGVAVDVIDPRHGADVAMNADVDLGLVLALHAQQVADLEGLAGVADEQLAVGRDGALVDAEQAELAAEGVVADLEDVGDDVLVGVGGGRDRFGRGAFALEKLRRGAFGRVLAFTEEAGGDEVALGRIGQQAAHDVEQLGDAGAAAGRGEAHGDQVAFAQGLLKRVVELFGLEGFALFEIERHEFFVHFDDLIDDAVVGVAHAGEGRCGGVVGLEEAVDHAGAAGGGQVDRQAFLAEAGGDAFHQGGKIHARCVDAIDDEHAALAGRGVHGLAGDGFDAGRGVDDDDGGFDRGQRGQRAAEKVGQARGVENIDPVLGPFEVGEGAVEGVTEGFFLGVVVADGVAFFNRTGCTDGAGGGEEFFQQGGFAAAGLAQQAEVADVADRGGCHACSLCCFIVKARKAG